MTIKHRNHTALGRVIIYVTKKVSITPDGRHPNVPVVHELPQYRNQSYLMIQKPERLAGVQIRYN